MKLIQLFNDRPLHVDVLAAVIALFAILAAANLPALRNSAAQPETVTASASYPQQNLPLIADTSSVMVVAVSPAYTR